MTVMVWYLDGSRGLVSGRDAQAVARLAWRSGQVVAVFPASVGGGS